MKKVYVLIILSIGAQVALFARQVTDMAGRTVELPDSITRVVPYDNKTNVLLFPIAGDLMAAKARSMGAPDLKYVSKEFLRLREIDTKNAEEMLKLAPDFIIVGAFVDRGESLSVYLDFSEKTGIPMVFADLELTALDASYRFLGQLFNREEKAEELSGFVKMVFQNVERCRDSKTIDEGVYIANETDGLRTTPVGSSHAQLLEIMNIPNVVNSSLGANGFANVSIEQVIAWNPDYIFCLGKTTTPYRTILKSALWRNIAAVKKKQVFHMPSLPYPWFDMPPSINRLAGLIWFPEIFYGQSPAITMQKIKDFYSLFYNYDLTNKEYENLFKWQ